MEEKFLWGKITLKTCKIFILLGVVVLFLSFNAVALQMGASIKPEIKTVDSVTELSQRISRRFHDVQSLSFSWTQKTYIAKSTEIVSAEVLYIKPDKLHIKYTSPFEQEIIFTDGYLYTYVPEINQAIKQKKDSISDIAGITPSLLLSTEPFKLMESDFSISIINGKSDFIRLKAVPIEKNNFDSITIFFDPDTLFVMKTKIIAANITSETTFKWGQTPFNLNSVCPYLDFKLPDDVEIIEIQ